MTVCLCLAQVLDSKENNMKLKSAAPSAAESFKNARTANATPGVTLSWFHRLLRNVLVHGSLSTQRQFLDMYPQPLSAFIEDGRVRSVLTRTFAAKQLPAAIDKKQSNTQALLGAAKLQRGPATRQLHTASLLAAGACALRARACRCLIPCNLALAVNWAGVVSSRSVVGRQEAWALAAWRPSGKAVGLGACRQLLVTLGAAGGSDAALP